MKQSRTMSAVESMTNVAVGFGVAVATQTLVFPLFGLHATMQQHLAIGVLFTVVSVVRSYALRRLFEALRVRGARDAERIAPSPSPLHSVVHAQVEALVTRRLR